MENALATARPPTTEAISIVESVSNKLILESESEIAHTNHVFKMKVARAKFLLFRKVQLQKKIAEIDHELDSMATGDLTRP